MARMALLDAMPLHCRIWLGRFFLTGWLGMTDVRTQLLALRKEANEQRMKFGGPIVSLVWWDDERPLPIPGDPDKYHPLSRYADPIGELQHPPHPSLWKTAFAVGTVYFDPNDSEPEAVGVFRRLAKRIGGFLAELHPELTPMLVATNPDLNWRDLTLAWIFRTQFYEGLEDPIEGVVIRDAFGRLNCCIDELLAAEESRVKPPKRAYKPSHIGKWNWSVTVPYTGIHMLPNVAGDGKDDSMSLTTETLVGQLKSVEQAVLLALWHNSINDVHKKKTGPEIAKLPTAGLQHNTQMKEALSLLQQEPYRFVTRPGHGYYLTERGVAAGELLNSKMPANKKSGQSRR